MPNDAMPTTSASAPVAVQFAPPLTPTALTRSSATTTIPVALRTSGETIERPPEHTLARGRYEAKPATIWIFAAFGALFGLAWLLLRVRSTRRAEAARIEASMRLRRQSVARGV
jgi:hypothetical protein